jgi:RNA polymerase sporulation-specific sigma factor
MGQYEAYTDEQLVAMSRDGDNTIMDYLMEKYKYLVRKKANALFLLGGDTDDLIQEGMIGLFKAVRDYDSSQGSFYRFAELCISRQIYTAIEAAARKKHGPLNSYVSLSRESTDFEGFPLKEDLIVQNGNPEQILIDRENLDSFLQKIYEHLSKMERQVLDAYLEGMNYHQIAKQMNKSDKAIDNALQRIRGKIQKLRKC